MCSVGKRPGGLVRDPVAVEALRHVVLGLAGDHAVHAADAQAGVDCHAVACHRLRLRLDGHEVDVHPRAAHQRVGRVAGDQLRVARALVRTPAAAAPPCDRSRAPCRRSRAGCARWPSRLHAVADHAVLVLQRDVARRPRGPCAPPRRRSATPRSLPSSRRGSGSTACGRTSARAPGRRAAGTCPDGGSAGFVYFGTGSNPLSRSGVE